MACRDSARRRSLVAFTPARMVCTRCRSCAPLVSRPSAPRASRHEPYAAAIVLRVGALPAERRRQRSYAVAPPGYSLLRARSRRAAAHRARRRSIRGMGSTTAAAETKSRRRANLDRECALYQGGPQGRPDQLSPRAVHVSGRPRGGLASNSVTSACRSMSRPSFHVTPAREVPRAGMSLRYPRPKASWNRASSGSSSARSLITNRGEPRGLAPK
jgi:hypothetical protein